VGLHPVVVLLALIVFSSVFGLLGALVAVPLALILAILGRQLRAAYLASDLYEESPPRPTD
jgi:predicted PurR-regulated permease PerM